MSSLFTGTERDRLFRQLQMPWYNLVPNAGVSLEPYALYHCHPVSQQQISRMKDAAERVGTVLSHLWSVIRGFDEETLLEYGFPEETVRVIKFDGLPPFCMRLDWCWNEQEEVYKVIEANVQTPSFWFECLEGNAKVAEHFGFKPAETQIQSVLRNSINQAIKRAANWLGKSLDRCNIAMTTLDNPEDMGTMRWLSKFVDQPHQVFEIEQLRIKDHQYLFNERSGEAIDILFMWYPVEWAIFDRDPNGQELWSALEELILKRKLVIVNFASAFALQPKSIFALITDLGLDFFSPEQAETVFDLFPKTVQISEEMGDTYFGKPVFGRQGEGCFSVIAGEISDQSPNQDPWYTDQFYVYQELLKFPTIDLANKEMTALWSTWLFNDGTDHFVPAGIGLRVSEGKITDDYSYWCPIGIAN
ncbi:MULTISPECIES: glutathionylspermidine synthase family protein [Leptolyngbya]|uniref:glutathionylspermidine synthase family protein n=1 Tax=Leptolyngbya TaxID=47251 RepID=UPI0016846440|nr:glutathionylspermidine synthase family protein [Leptolyngbya sp. FACHB-1624]MBD1858118.1 glutathionylspermidine synthase family protein [Leptolyngbya sp. FACHB-1624]